MKKLVTLIIALLITITALAQVQAKKNDASPETNQKYDIVPYRLFQTQNIWTFIKLDTRNGQMWQVQYSVNDENRFETILNLVPLVAKEEEKNGRFTLYPTQNIYNFILLDQFDGRLWQVQWSAEIDKRLLVPIK